MKLIATDTDYNWLEVEPDTIPPKLLTQLNATVQWCMCPMCRSRRIYSILYRPKHHCFYCTDCKTAYIGERRINE
jgi:hypothetical protein